MEPPAPDTLTPSASSSSSGFNASLKSCLKPNLRHFRVSPAAEGKENDHKDQEQPGDNNQVNNCSIVANTSTTPTPDLVTIIDRRRSFTNLSKRFKSRNKISITTPPTNNASSLINNNNVSTPSLTSSASATAIRTRRSIFSSFIHLNDDGDGNNNIQDDLNLTSSVTELRRSEFGERFFKQIPVRDTDNSGGQGVGVNRGNNDSTSSSINGFRKFLTIATFIYVCFVSLQLPVSLAAEFRNTKRDVNLKNNNGGTGNVHFKHQSIWNELTEDEIRSIFGHSHSPSSKINPDSVPNFDIVEPQISEFTSTSTIRRRRRSLEDNSNEKFIQIQGLGRSFNLSLSQNRNLLDPHFVFLKRHENKSEIMPEKHLKENLHCFYQGIVEHEDISRNSGGQRALSYGPVALNLCGGLKGFILSSDAEGEDPSSSDHDSQYDDYQHHYVIHPVPVRLHNKKKPSSSPSSSSEGRKTEHVESGVEHFLFKRQQHGPLFGSASSVKHAKSSLNNRNNDKTVQMNHETCSHNNENHNQDQLTSKGTKIRKRRSTDFFGNYGDIRPLDMAPDSYWHHYRSNLFSPSRAISSSAVFPSSYWRQKSAESSNSMSSTLTGTGNAGRRRQYGDDDNDEYEHDTSSSSITNIRSDPDWPKSVLVYESTSTNEEPDTILPFYTKGGRKRASKLGKSNSNSNWEPMQSSGSGISRDGLPYSARSSGEGGLEYSQNYSTSSSSKFFRKGRRDDAYFGSDWKSPLDSNYGGVNKPDKSNMKQSRYDLDSNMIYSREREKPPSQLTIETAVFVDKDLYKHMQSNFPDDTHGEVVRIVLAMINAVQLLYQDPSLGHRVDFVLKRLEVLETDPPGLLRPYDIDRFLTNFCKWQKTENPTSDADPLHWDHALILTGLDLYVVHQSGKISNQVVGLAPVAGMCTRSSSCTVNEGRHFESVFVISHEIGHNLGMRHDGPQADNDCDPTSHIMSPTLGSGKITWSPCSRKYLDMFLETSQSKCLLDKAKSEIRLDHDADGRLPGERFDADRQCVLKYGRGSFHATQQPLEDVCRDLHCRREHYTWTSHPALEGTYCGTEMWCRAGKCVGKTSFFTTTPHHEDHGDLIGSNHLPGSETAAYSLQKAVDGVWGKWSLFTDCSSACLHSDDGKLLTGSTGIRLAARRCDSPRPENGGRQCSGPDRRYKTCHAHKVGKICSGNIGRTTINQYANDVCNRAAAVDHDLTGMGFMMSTNDAERACSVWCETLDNGVPRSRGWSFPDGTSCKVISQSSSSQSYCVAGKCQDFACNAYSYYALSDEECSFSSSNEVTPQSSWYNGNSNSGSQNANGLGPQKIATTRNGKTGAGWTDWESHSECKLPCLAPAKGLELVKRICSTGDTLCTGLALSVRLCKPDKATIMRNGCTRLQTPFEYATKVCSKYAEKIPGLSGIGMQLSPTKEDKDRPCRIGCQDVSIPYRFYMVNGEDGWFAAGTDCSRGDPDKKAYCVAGKCVDFGSDDTPLYRVHTKLMGRIETLFQRNKRQASYNIMEPLRVPSTMDESSLRELVHKFSERTGNYPSIDTSSMGHNNNVPLDFTRPIVMHNRIDYPQSSSPFRSRYSPAGGGYQKSNNGRSSSSTMDSYAYNYNNDNLGYYNNNGGRTHGSYHDDSSNRGRSFTLDYADTGERASGRMIPSSSYSGNYLGQDYERQRQRPSSHNGVESTSTNNWNGPIEGSFYEWRKIVSDCSVACGKGIQEVIVECVSGDTVVSDKLCVSRPRPGYSGYVDCNRSSSCALSQRSSSGGGGQENSHIWDWLQSIIPKNTTKSSN